MISISSDMVGIISDINPISTSFKKIPPNPEVKTISPI